MVQGSATPCSDGVKKLPELALIGRLTGEINVQSGFQVYGPIGVQLYEYRNDAFLFAQRTKLLRSTDVRQIRSSGEKGEGDVAAVLILLDLGGPTATAVQTPHIEPCFTALSGEILEESLSQRRRVLVGIGDENRLWPGRLP